jgi:hypothetical protein
MNHDTTGSRPDTDMKGICTTNKCPKTTEKWNYALQQTRQHGHCNSARDGATHDLHAGRSTLELNRCCRAGHTAISRHADVSRRCDRRECSQNRWCCRRTGDDRWDFRTRCDGRDINGHRGAGCAASGVNTSSRLRDGDRNGCAGQARRSSNNRRNDGLLRRDDCRWSRLG